MTVFKDDRLDGVMKEIFKREFVSSEKLVELANALILFLGGANAATDKKLEQAVKDLKALSDKQDQSGKDAQATLATARKEIASAIKQAINDASAEMKNDIENVRAQIPEETDLSGVHERLSRLAAFDGLKPEDIVNQIPVYGERVRDALELLQGDERLDISAIKGLAELIEKVNAKSSIGGVHFVGGTNGMILYVNGAKQGTIKYLNFIPGAGIALSSVIQGNRVDLTIRATGGGGTANIAMEKLNGTQSGGNITLDLTQLANPYTGILLITRNGQVVAPGTDPGDGSSRWSKSGNTITVYNADAGEIFLVQYTY